MLVTPRLARWLGVSSIHIGLITSNLNPNITHQ
jgi:hypothetical protein